MSPYIKYINYSNGLIMRYIKTPYRFFRHLLTLPFIFSAIIPILILDIWIEIFHRISFPFYRIPYVKRGQYIKIDRHKLSYLDPMQKLNCAYCGYANGVLQYCVQIFGETEKYWCSINHEKDEIFIAPPHPTEFNAYNNEEEYIKEYKSKRTRQFF